MDVRQVNELFEAAKRLAADSRALRDALEVEFLGRQLWEVVAEDYDLGEILGVDQVFGGYVNVSFSVRTQTKDGEHRYFVRKYKGATTEREVRFEHALVTHLNGKGFHLAAPVLPARTGSTFVTREESLDGETVTRLFAVYEMLGGMDKYTWVKNHCTDKEYASAARVLADFHHVGHDFDPGELARAQPPIMEFLHSLNATLTSCAARGRGGSYDECLLLTLPRILEVLEKGLAIEAELVGMPFIPVHCDYHPGNQKYVDEQVVGLFDFDWSKIDYRVFDVALALVYFCSSWEGRDTGDLWVDKCGLFLDAYQDESARFDVPGPLTASELAVLPRMLANANLFVLQWCASAYYENLEANDDEYLFYLQHNVALMDFIERHQDELEGMARAAEVAGGREAGVA